MAAFTGPLSNSVDQQADELIAGLGADPSHKKASERAFVAFTGPLSNSVDQQVDELMANLGKQPSHNDAPEQAMVAEVTAGLGSDEVMTDLGSDSPHSDEEESFDKYTGGVGFELGYGLMNIKKLLSRPMGAYNVTVGRRRVHVDPAKMLRDPGLTSSSSGLHKPVQQQG